MKLFYFEHQPYMESLFAPCQELGINNWEIGPEYKRGYGETEDSKIAYKNPVIFCDEDQFVPCKKLAESEAGCPLGWMRISYANFKKNLQRVVAKDEEVILCLSFEDHYYKTKAVSRRNGTHGPSYINILDWLLQITDRLHLVLLIKEPFFCEDYHEILKYISLLSKINTLSVSFVNIYKLTNEPELCTDEEIEEKIYTSLQALADTKKSFAAGNKKEINLFNWQTKQYSKYLLTEKDFFDKKIIEPDILVDFAPSDGRKMCKMLKSWRKAYAAERKLAYQDKQCHYTGECRGACPECDREASILYEGSSFDFAVEPDFNIKADIRGISRLRYNSDGKGLRTLVLFNACPLACKYCINKSLIKTFLSYRSMNILELGMYLEQDFLYFSMDGGVTFGGGEPLLSADFIHEFHLAYPKINLAIETSLNVPLEKVTKVIDDIDEWIIDIKDMNSEIYHSYTGKDNALVKSNLTYLLDKIGAEKLRVRVPEIVGYNNEEDVKQSVRLLEEMGISKIDALAYKVV